MINIPEGVEKVRVFHQRQVNFDASLPGAPILPKGGSTVAWLLGPEDTILARGEAICSPRDAYSKETGRAIALGRAICEFTGERKRREERDARQRRDGSAHRTHTMTVWQIWVRGDDHIWLEAAWDDDSTAENPEGWKKTVDRCRALSPTYEVRVQKVSVPGVFDLFEVPAAEALTT